MPVSGAEKVWFVGHGEPRFTKRDFEWIGHGVFSFALSSTLAHFYEQLH